MKKIGLLAAALCLFSADAGAAFVSPYVGADYNYSSLNFGITSDQRSPKLIWGSFFSIQ